MPAKRFRIAFSFAGEKRAFVKQVADLLSKRFGQSAILYDKYHEAEFANADLAFELPSLYKDQSDLIVSVFCPDYEMKEWCGLEWRAIFSIIKERGAKQVLLTRFEHVDGKGLHGLAGFIELDDKTPDEAVILILERLALNEELPKDHYTKSSPAAVPTVSTSIPHNLPTLQPFFGREDELRKIADALDPESRTWGALIDGPGGMGKTSLAVRAAYDASSEVFQRIIFVSLKTRELDDDGVRDLSGFLVSGLIELFGELASELDRDDIVKAAEDQRPRLLIDALRGTQTLLLLDNLESLVKKDRDTLFTFVKKLPSGCKAILTSRGRIGSGAEELILEKLSEEAALATLAELATHNPALAKTSEADRIVLYRETGGKPLLLRWTAGQIGRGHCLTFTDALAYLRSCPAGNDPLEFIFGDLVEDFSPEEEKALCALTYFSQPATVEHIAAIAGVEVGWAVHSPAPHVGGNPDGAVGAKCPTTLEDVDRALRSLVNRSLVVPSDEFQNYSLVPMVADFLRKAKPMVVAETGDRLEQRAYSLIIENGFDRHDRYPVLDAAWSSVAPALPLFLGGANERLQTICNALQHFLSFSGRWDERIALSGQAEAKAVSAGDFERAGWRAYDAGWIHYVRRQEEEVISCANRAKIYWDQAFPSGGEGTSGTRERAIAIHLRGQGHSLKRDYQAAIVAFQEVVELHRSLSAESGDVAIALSNLAEVELRSGDIEAAEQNWLEALGFAQGEAYAAAEAAIKGNLVSIELARRNWLSAETLSREALALSETIGRQDLIASDCYRIAVALLKQCRHEDALPYAHRAVEILERLGSPNLGEAQAILSECEAVV